MLPMSDQPAAVFAEALTQHSEVISKKPVSANLNLLLITKFLVTDFG